MQANPIVVLVVEDEPLIRMDTIDCLEEAGYEVFEAENADKAILLLESNPNIRLVFTDIDMPGSMDGLKLVAAVRRRWPPVLVIVTSGQRLIEITDIPDGSMFFAKPYDHTEILGSMHTLLQGNLS